MKPIPKNLLIHSAELYTVVTDRWGAETETLTAELNGVRVEPARQVNISGDNREAKWEAVLYYDCVNSAPNGVTFSPEQVVKHGGKRYRVIGAQPYSDTRGVHHWEVQLHG